MLLILPTMSYDSPNVDGHFEKVDKRCEYCELLVLQNARSRVCNSVFTSKPQKTFIVPVLVLCVADKINDNADLYIPGLQ